MESRKNFSEEEKKNDNDLYIASRIYDEEVEIGLEKTVFSAGRDKEEIRESLAKVRHFLWEFENDMVESPEKELIELIARESLSAPGLMQMINYCCIDTEGVKAKVNTLLEGGAE
ncbi:MAG: hypothetical protein K6G40_08995 [Eubacterium sp.]|nr:hypothetical protein [Eubacterium sp.]